MKNENFKEVSEKEKRARLLNVIIKKCNGKIDLTLAENIVNNIDIDSQYQIICIENSKELARHASLSCNYEWHSDSKGSTQWWIQEFKGSDSKKSLFKNEDLQKPNFDAQELQYCLGTDSILKFAMSYKSSRYEGSEITNNYSSLSTPIFNTKEQLAFVVENSEWLPNIEYTSRRVLYIYVPEDVEYKVSPKIGYILDNFNIK